MDENMIGYICGGLLIVTFFIFGVSTIIFGIRNRKKAEASQAWPAAPGVITQGWIEESRDTDEDGYTTYSYKPRWKYEYQVSEQTYASDRIGFGGQKTYSNRRQAEQELVRFPVNSQVRAYFNPADPSESTLIRGTKGTMGGIIAGVILLLLSVCGCLGGLYFVLTNL